MTVYLIPKDEIDPENLTAREIERVGVELAAVSDISFDGVVEVLEKVADAAREIPRAFESFTFQFRLAKPIPKRLRKADERWRRQCTQEGRDWHREHQRRTIGIMPGYRSPMKRRGQRG